MTDTSEFGMHIVPWRAAASTVHLCARCRVSYAPARFCGDCLREVNASPTEKHGVLFPRAYDDADMLSTVA